MDADGESEVCMYECRHDRPFNYVLKAPKKPKRGLLSRLLQREEEEEEEYALAKEVIVLFFLNPFFVCFSLNFVQEEEEDDEDFQVAIHDDNEEVVDTGPTNRLLEV